LMFIVALAAAMGMARSAEAEAVSPWSEDLQSRMRLITTGAAADGSVAAAVEITLAPGFKTYWRHPGEAGVPPLFDFSASSNLASFEVLYPRPEVIEDESGRMIGYHRRVIFPLRVVAKNAAEAVALDLKLSYGACEKICIPATGAAALTLGGAPDAVLAGDIAAALATVPASVTKGESGPHPILKTFAQHPMPGQALDPGAPSTRLTLKIGDGSGAQILAEGPEGWFLETAPSKENGSDGAFTISFFGPRKTSYESPCPVRLTILGKEKAVERSLTLDECGVKP
jgi:hypothetical protein